MVNVSGGFRQDVFVVAGHVGFRLDVLLVAIVVVFLLAVSWFTRKASSRVTSCSSLEEKLRKITRNDLCIHCS